MSFDECPDMALLNMQIERDEKTCEEVSILDRLFLELIKDRACNLN